MSQKWLNVKSYQKFIVRVRLCRTRAYEVFIDRVFLKIDGRRKAEEDEEIDERCKADED